MSWMIPFEVGKWIRMKSWPFGASESETEKQIPEIRLILVGKAGAGKSTTGNAILGQETFEASVRTESSHLGIRRWKEQRLVLIDTPDISRDSPDSPKVQHCLRLSLPGPHALVLVTQLGRFTEEDQAAMGWIRKVFGHKAMENTFLIFAGETGGETLEEYLARPDNESHRVMANECGGGSYVFGHKRKGGRQVGELLSKIEERVEGNRPFCLFERAKHPKEIPEVTESKLAQAIPQGVLVRVEMETPQEGGDPTFGQAPIIDAGSGNVSQRAVQEELQDAMESQDPGGSAAGEDASLPQAPMANPEPGILGLSSMEQEPPESDRAAAGAESSLPQEPMTNSEPGSVSLRSEEPELRIVLVGKTGGGRSASGNTILGKTWFESRLDCNTVTKTCQLGIREWREKRVIVMDTPAIFDSEGSKNSAEIQHCRHLSGPRPRALVLVVQLGRFTEEDHEAVQWVNRVFGAEVSKSMIVLFTRREDLKRESLDEYIFNSDNKHFRELIEACGNRYCGFNNHETGERQEKQAEELLSKIEELLPKNQDEPFWVVGKGGCPEAQSRKKRAHEEERNPHSAPKVMVMSSPPTDNIP